jgi:hypothetical protein
VDEWADKRYNEEAGELARRLGSEFVPLVTSRLILFLNRKTKRRDAIDPVQDSDRVNG